MTKQEFQRIRILHVGDRNRCAELIGMNYRAVLRYENGECVIPWPVAIIMMLIEDDPTIIKRLEQLSKLD